MRILLAALTCVKGDPVANLAAHTDALRRAREADCRLAVFPEMSLTGSVEPRTQPHRLLPLDADPVTALVAGTTEVAAVFGVAERAGEAAHITQVYADRGRLVGAYRKRHLADDEPGFTPGAGPALFDLDGRAFGVAICAEGGVDYPFDEPVAAGAGLVLFCAAPGLYGRRTDAAGWRSGFDWWERHGLGDARRHAVRTGAWVALATQAGSTEDEDFPGISALVAPDGEVVARLPDWRPGDLVVEVP